MSRHRRHTYVCLRLSKTRIYLVLLHSYGYPILPFEEESFYQIGSAGDFEWNLTSIRDSENVYIELTDDIDMTGIAWTKMNNGTVHYIGTEEQPFYGRFDGKGHVIRNVTLGVKDNEGNGIFGVIAGNAKISNVGIENVTAVFNDASEFTYYGSTTYGALAGTIKDGAEVNNCYAKDVTIQLTADKGNYIYAAGGLAGRMEGNGAKVKNSYATGVNIITSTSDIDYDSGLVGLVNSMHDRIINCYTDTSLARTKNTVTNYNDIAENCYYVWGHGDGTDGKLPWPWTDQFSSFGGYIGTRVDADVLKTKKSELGVYFTSAAAGANNGFPVLAWERNMDVIEKVYLTTKDFALIDGLTTDNSDSNKRYYTNKIKIAKNSEGTAKLAIVSYKAGKVTKVTFADIDANGIYRIYNPVQSTVGDVATSPDTVKVFMFSDLDNVAVSAETVTIE